MDNNTIYLDGQYTALRRKDLERYAPGILPGLGVFETMLCDDHCVFFLDEHVRRFRHGCDRYILPHAPSSRNIKNVLGKLLKVNSVRGGRVRLCAWRQGWACHLMIAVLPRTPLAKAVYRKGFDVGVYPGRFDRPPQISKIKSLDYTFYQKAYERARTAGRQEAVLVNSWGFVVEASRSNIFCLKKGILWTPSLTSGCLAGITRQNVLKLAKSRGLKVATEQVTLSALQDSDEAFLTNALVGIMPLTRLKGRKIGAGRPGPWTIRLSQSYQKLSQDRATFLL